MSEPIWNGDFGNPEIALQRAEGVNIPIGTVELNKLVQEIIASQKGILIANNGVKNHDRQLAELRDRLDGDNRERLEAIMGGFAELTAAVTSSSSAIERFLEQLLKQHAPTDSPDWSALAKGLIAYGDTNTQVFKEFCAQLAKRDAEKDELLAEFGGNTDQVRYYVNLVEHVCLYLGGMLDTTGKEIAARMYRRNGQQ